MAEVVAGCRRVFTVSAVTHTWVPFDWESLEDEPPVTASLCGLLYPGHTHLFSGEPDSGKSWLAAWICAELVASGDTVIWVDLEQSPRVLHERLRALGLEAEEIAERFVLLSPQEPLAEDIARAVDALVATRRPRLVVVDSMIGLVSLHGYSSNDGGDIEALYRDVLSRFRACGAALVVLDHLPKDRENRGQFAIGSERKVGVVDVHVRVACVEPFARGRSGRLRLQTMKDRFGWLPRGELGIVDVRSDRASGRLEMEVKLVASGAAASTEKWKPTAMMEKVSRLLESAAPEQLPKNRILSAGLGRRAYVEQALDVLVEEGYLRRSIGARNAVMHELQQPYRDATVAKGSDGAHSCSHTPPPGDDSREKWVADLAAEGCGWTEIEDQLGDLEDDERTRLLGVFLAA